MKDLLQLLLEPVLEFMFLFFGYVVGYFPVVLGSLGLLEPGPLRRVRDANFYRSKGRKWWHITYCDRGKTYLTAEAVAFIGWIVLAAMYGVIWLVVRAAISSSG